MKVKCPHCQRSLKISEQMAGRKATCPACQQRIVVPATVTEGEPKLASVPKPAREAKPILQERDGTSRSLLASVNKDRLAEKTVEADTTASPQARASSDHVAPVRSALQKSWNVTAVQSLKAAGWSKRFGILLTQRGLSIVARARDETVGSVQCYRTHREAFWKQLLSGPLRFWKGEGSLAQDVEFFIPERERIETDWMVDLPNRCVACGIETNQPERQQVRTLESFAKTCRAIWIALTIAIVLLWWQPSVGIVRLGWWLAPLLFAVATLVAFRMRRQESATVRFCCCSEHAQNDRYPKLFLVSGGLLVRVGTARASRWLQSERQDHRRQRRDREIVSDDSPSLPVPLPASLEGTEFDAPSMPDAARTIALVEDVEPTPIVHAVSTLRPSGSISAVDDAASVSSDAGTIGHEELPIDLPAPIVASILPDAASFVAPLDAESPAPTAPVVLSSAPQSSLADSQEEVSTAASPIDDEIMDGILVEDNDEEGPSRPKFAELAANTTPEIVADTKTIPTSDNVAVPEKVGMLDRFTIKVFKSFLFASGLFWTAVMSGAVLSGLARGAALGPAWKHELESFALLTSPPTVYGLLVFAIIHATVAGRLARLLDKSRSFTAWSVATFVFPFYTPAVLFVERPASTSPGRFSPVGAVAGTAWTAYGLLQLFGLGLLLPSLVAQLGMTRGNSPSGIILLPLVFPGVPILVLYFFAAGFLNAGFTSLFNANRKSLLLNGIGSIGIALLQGIAALVLIQNKQRIKGLPEGILEFPAIVYSLPVLLIVAGLIAITGSFLSSPDSDNDSRRQGGNATGPRKFRADTSRNSTNRSYCTVLAIKAAVVVTFTGILIAFVVPNVPSWMSQLFQQVGRLQPLPTFEPWTAAQEVAVHQLEAKGAKVSRNPKMVTSRHYVENVLHDSRTGKVTKTAFAEIHIDLETSSVADDDIPAIVQLKGDRIHQELKRVVVRGSKLSQDGILELRNALPNTVLDE